MSTYTLHHGDCLEITPTLEAGSVDAIICDPPYGTTACSWDSVIPFAPMWAEIKRLLKPRGACVLFGTEPFSSLLRVSNLAWYRYDWVWDKVNMFTNQMNAHLMPMKQHELISVFSALPVRYRPQKRVGNPYKTTRSGKISVFAVSPRDGENTDGMMYPGSVLSIPARNPKEQGLHPTQKPLALLEYLVKTYTDEGETVLDFTMGSGTTGHACMNLRRRFIGIEQDAAYFAIAEARIADAADPLRHMYAQETPQ
jgi:site-specific DNA-methyltransferase (adenine-specific)